MSHLRAAKRQRASKMNKVILEQMYQQAKSEYPKLAKTYSRRELVTFWWNAHHPTGKV